MKTYPEMKDSGVEWIGKIPSHWDLVPLKRISQDIVSGGTPDTSNPDYWDDDGTPWVSISDMTENGKYLTGTKKGLSSLGLQSKGLSPIPLGSVFISIYGSMGKTSITMVDCVSHQGILGIIPHNRWINGDFLFLSLNDLSGFVSTESSTNTQGNLSLDKVRRIPLPLPPLHEQQEIVSFLDEKTGLIDDLITKKTRRIELLKEMRSSLISEVVTKGLDPDVEMKDSGVEWIGEIPSHWGIGKLRYLFRMEGGGTPSSEKPEYWNGDIPWVSPKDMKSDEVMDTEDHVTELGVEESTTNLVPSGSILMVFRSGILKNTIPVAKISNPMTVNQDIKSFYTSSSELGLYFFYFVKGLNSVLLNLWRKEGTTVESLESKWVSDSPLPLPPLHEQQEIVSFLDEKTGLIDEEISREEESIIKLKELRESLISEVVTGKRDVRKVS
jgi:type I restriction enzyme S subunit